MLRVNAQADSVPSSSGNDNNSVEAAEFSAREERITSILKHTEDQNELGDAQRYCMSAIYMCAMGVCGLVLVAIGETLTVLAANLSLSSTDIGTVFLFRGMGSIFGAVMSAKLYTTFKGNTIMGIGLVIITVILALLPFNRSYWGLHIYFMLLGLATAVTDTGCQIQTRKLHGKNAGPWLGANTVAFGICGAIVPIIEVMTMNPYIEFGILSTLVGFTTIGMFTAPDIDQFVKNVPVPKRGDGKKGSHYRVEMVIGFMVFLFIGSKVTMTSYLYAFVDQTGMIDPTNRSRLMLLLWIAITVGRLAGVYDQSFVTNITLPYHLFALSVGAATSMLLVFSEPHRSIALWLGVGFFGLFNGPCIGYCYDLNNRLTYPSELSMSIVMLGLNFGASLVPYVSSFIWQETGDPWTLIWMCFICNSIPLCLIFVVKRLSYDPTVNPYLKDDHPYESVAANEDVDDP